MVHTTWTEVASASNHKMLMNRMFSLKIQREQRQFAINGYIEPHGAGKINVMHYQKNKAFILN